jgi:hypothetical protein
MVWVRDSRVNHETRIPASMAACPSASKKCDLPVPEGPHTARFSAREIHSRVRSAAWVGAGKEASASRSHRPPSLDRSGAAWAAVAGEIR